MIAISVGPLKIVESVFDCASPHLGAAINSTPSVTLASGVSATGFQFQYAKGSPACRGPPSPSLTHWVRTMRIGLAYSTVLLWQASHTMPMPKSRGIKPGPCT